MSLKISEETTFLLDMIQPTYGPELATGWDTSAWWSVLESGWSVDEGVDLDCDGTIDAQARKSSFFTADKSYRIIETVSLSSGELLPLYDGSVGAPIANITSSGTYSYNYTPGATTLYCISSNPGFNGSVTGISIKEIL